MDNVQQVESGPDLAKNRAAQSEPSPALALDDSTQQETVEGYDAIESTCPSDTFATNPEAFGHIMSRVTSKVPLQILESSIPDAGYKLFVGEDIPAGEDVFTSQPLVNFVNMLRKETCDYCLARPYTTVSPDGALQNSRPFVDNKEPSTNKAILLTWQLP
jgi:hypothetical protein